MTQNETLPAHELATLLPSHGQRELAELVESMKARGFDRRHPIVLFEGSILDGRGRYRAAHLAGVDPVYEDFEGTEDEAIAFFLNANVKRRHLNKRQRAEIEIRAATLRGETPSYTEIARRAGVDKATVSRLINGKYP